MSELRRTRVLILLPHFLPGRAYGGPVRTVSNLMERLGGEFEFHLLTSDHDFRSSTPYDLPADQWLDWRGRARVRYASPAGRTASALAAAIRDTAPDLLYLNSLFHPRFSLLPLQLWRWGRLGHCGLALAPRGELAPAALAQKPWRKRLFLAAARAAGGYGRVAWQASGDHEAGHIRAAWPRALVVTAPNLGVPPGEEPPRQRVKRPGELRLLFLGRVSRMKNLPFLLERLDGLPGRVELQVAGPAEDAALLDGLRRRAAGLPGLQVEFLGEVEPDAAGALLREADLLVQPSLGENFGQSILEALCRGLPVLVSDRTPWRGLSGRGAGWDLPLEDPGAFRQALETALSWSEEDRRSWAEAARRLGRERLEDPAALEGHRELFRRARERAR